LILLAVVREELAEPPCGTARVVRKPTLREAHDLVAESFQLHVAGTVGFEGGAAGVRSVAVQLHDQARR
jgi:hypothetical protein